MGRAARRATLPWGALGLLVAFAWLPLGGAPREAAEALANPGVEAPAPPVWEALAPSVGAAPFVAPLPTRRVRRVARPSAAPGPAVATPPTLPRHRALRWYGRRLLEGG